MLDNMRRLAIRDIVLAWRVEVMQRPPGLERARKANELGKVISALNSAKTDSEVGRALLDMYGVR